MRDLLEKIDLIINEKRNKSKEEEDGKKVRDFFSGRTASEYDKNLLALVQALPDNPSWNQIKQQMDKALDLEPPGLSFNWDRTNTENFMQMLGAANGLEHILAPGEKVIDTKTGETKHISQYTGQEKGKKIFSAQNALGMIPPEYSDNKDVMADLGGQIINHGIKTTSVPGAGLSAGQYPAKEVPGAGLSAGQYPATAKQSSKPILKLSDLEKMVVNQKNIGQLLTAYNDILKKYGSNINEAKVSKRDVANDLKMLTAIRTAIQRGLDNGTLPKNSSRTLVNKILKGQSKHTAMLQKAAGFNTKSDSAADITGLNGERYGVGDTTTTGYEKAVAQKVTPGSNSQSGSEIPEPSTGGQPTSDEKSIAGQMQNQVKDVGELAGPMQQQVQQFVSNYLASDARTKQMVVNYLQKTIDPLKPKAPDTKNQQDLTKQNLTFMPNDPRLDTPPPPNDTVTKPAKPVKPAQQGNLSFTTQSTDFNDLLKLAGTKQLTEASMNISMNGNTSAEVAELMNLLKNAGLDDAKPVADLGMFKTVDEPAPCPMCAAAHGADSPCGEAVEEEWDNSPDEEYQDDEYMIHDLSGGINRKKERAAQRVKDPAVAYESKFKSMLKSSLEEMYQKKRVDEKDPFARLKQATGTGMGGKQHSQYKQFANKTPMKIGPAKAPGANGIAGALAKGPGMAGAPKAAAVPTSAAAPKATLSPDTHAMLKSVFPKQYAPERAQRLYDILDQKTGDAMSWLRKKTGKL